MSENILQTAQHLVQDVISPDIRELKANLSALEKQIAALEKHMDVRFDAVDEKTDARLGALDLRLATFDHRLDSMDKKSDAQFNALLAAISEAKAQAELTNMRVIASLSERVAILESQRH
jgi:flagellar capping protein FliD